jgi:hypothetical protein
VPKKFQIMHTKKLLKNVGEIDIGTMIISVQRESLLFFTDECRTPPPIAECKIKAIEKKQFRMSQHWQAVGYITFH